MKTYHIKLNERVYEIEVEEVKNGTSSLVSSTTSVEVAAKQTPQSSAGEEVLAPLPGTVFAIAATVGKVVKRGEVIMVLEAMKMENEIVAHMDGTVQAVNVEKGASVVTGDCLLVLA